MDKKNLEKIKTLLQDLDEDNKDRLAKRASNEIDEISEEEAREEIENIENTDFKKRSFVKKAVGGGTLLVGTFLLGMITNEQVSAYDPNERTVYGENIQNLDGIIGDNYSESNPLELPAIKTPSTDTEQGFISKTFFQDNPQLSSRRTKLSLSELGDTWTEVGEYNSTDTDVRYPSIIHAESVFDSPLGKWYIYTAPYNTDYIDLYYSDNIEGSFTKYGSHVLTAETDSSQADSPHVVYVPKVGELWMYYHETGGGAGTGNQYTMLATSADTGDGTSWTKYGDPTPVLDGRLDGRWDDNERTYFTVQRVGNMFIGTYQGRDESGSERGIGIAWSPDGKNWQTSKIPVGLGNILSTYNPQSSNLHAPTLLNIGGKLVIGYVDSSDSDYKFKIFSLNQINNYVTEQDSIDFFTVTTSATIAPTSASSIDYNQKTYIPYNNRIGYLDWEEYL